MIAHKTYTFFLLAKITFQEFVVIQRFLKDGPPNFRNVNNPSTLDGFMIHSVIFTLSNVQNSCRITL